MRNRTTIGMVLPLLLVCFAAGVLSVVLQPPAEEESRSTDRSDPALPILSISPTPDTTSTILIFGVDAFDEENSGTLLAVWLLSYQSRQQPLKLLGLPYDTRMPDGSTLRESFSIFEPPEYGAAFINAMAGFTPHPVQGWVVLDQTGFARLVDYMGGYTLGDQHYDGSRTLGALNLLQDRPQENLTLQAQILRALVEKAPALGRTPEVTTLTTLVPNHAVTYPSAPQLATLAIPFLPIEPVQVQITLYTDG